MSWIEIQVFIHNIPSHALYVDDIMVFSKGNMNSIDANSNLFNKYASCSGQYINPSKSIIYFGPMTIHKHHIIVTNMGLCIGQLLFLYLGAPIFIGKPK